MNLLPINICSWFKWVAKFSIFVKNKSIGYKWFFNAKFEKSFASIPVNSSIFIETISVVSKESTQILYIF